MTSRESDTSDWNEEGNYQFVCMIIPNANHPVMAVPYFWRRQWDFFVRELLGKTPPAYQMKPYE